MTSVRKQQWQLDLWLSYSRKLVRNFYLRGLFPRGSRGQKSPSGVQGRSHSRDSPTEAEAVCRHCLHILTKETMKIWIFYTLYFLIRDQYVSQWGKRSIGGTKCSLVHAWRATARQMLNEAKFSPIIVSSTKTNANDQSTAQNLTKAAGFCRRKLPILFYFGRLKDLPISIPHDIVSLPILWLTYWILSNDKGRPTISPIFIVSLLSVYNSSTQLINININILILY